EIDKAMAAPVRKGDKIGDIEVIDISERKVVLKWMGQDINLSIEHIKTVDSPAAVRGIAPTTGVQTGAQPGAQPVRPSPRARRQFRQPQQPAADSE
ncbi:MAG: hypothetical protein WAV13_12210, partial [Thermodesulfovibrionales bacterium]